MYNSRVIIGRVIVLYKIPVVLVKNCVVIPALSVKDEAKERKVVKCALSNIKVDAGERQYIYV